ncbi:MAG: hypothetical protein ACYTF7_01905 [Planctomycetota bacterium]|jgi:anti-sigma factor RsiW
MTINNEDILISKAVDGVATAEEWSQLEALAAIDSSIWARLGEMTRMQAQLAGALDEAIAIADEVEIDMDRIHRHHALHIHVRTWGGWAVAAVLALALFGGQLGSFATSGGQQAAGWLGPNATPDEVLEQYRTVGTLDGRFVSELPTIMVDVRLNPESGQQEMFYMRRLLERVPVEGLYTSAPDGSDVVPVLIPAGVRTPDSPREF